jgi:hypothetical protein
VAVGIHSVGNCSTLAFVASASLVTRNYYYFFFFNFIHFAPLHTQNNTHWDFDIVLRYYRKWPDSCTSRRPSRCQRVWTSWDDSRWRVWSLFEDMTGTDNLPLPRPQFDWRQYRSPAVRKHYFNNLASANYFCKIITWSRHILKISFTYTPVWRRGPLSVGDTDYGYQ